MASQDNNRIVCNPAGKSSVWKHFGFSTNEDGTPVKDKAVCRLCYLQFHVHLERHHRSEYALLLNTDRDKLSEQSQPTLQKVLERSNPLPKDSERWQTLVEAISNFITSDMQPLLVVENAGFKKLLHTAEPRFKIPSRPYFTNTVIPAMYACNRAKTENVLSSIQYCSVTTDIWTAQHNTRSYISLTVHCVTSSWELASYCLSTKELSGEHAATNISTAIQETLNDWKIDTDKVIAVVTENAKNMTNAISELDLFNFPCIGHTLQLGVKRAFDVPKVHTTLARAGKLVAHFHRSPKSMSKLREKQKLLGLPEHQLIIDCITRWGSTYEMLKRSIEQQQAICAMLLEDGDNRSLIPSTDEITTIGLKF